MMTTSVSLRLDKRLLSMLSKGSQRTPLKKPELIRRTLRLHLQEVIEAEALSPAPRLSAISPWPKGALAKAYRRAGKQWDKVESAAAAQGTRERSSGRRVA
jgi:hypothetical protein